MKKVCIFGELKGFVLFGTGYAKGKSNSPGKPGQS